MSALTRIGLWRIFGMSLGIGAGIAYYKILEINKTIGDEILE